MASKNQSPEGEGDDKIFLEHVEALAQSLNDIGKTYWAASIQPPMGVVNHAIGGVAYLLETIIRDQLKLYKARLG